MSKKVWTCKLIAAIFAPQSRKRGCEIEKTSGSSSVGRARPCQGRGREFESRLPLSFQKLLKAIRK